MPTLVYLISLGGARPDAAERQARVLWLHRCATPQQTYTAIAKAMGISTGRARQLEDAALHRLRIGLTRSPVPHPTIPKAW
jgi:DNA-directed RNA polymerase sigma subunit (sigma70/sigma32)